MIQFQTISGAHYRPVAKPGAVKFSASQSDAELAATIAALQNELDNGRIERISSSADEKHAKGIVKIMGNEYHIGLGVEDRNASPENYEARLILYKGNVIRPDIEITLVTAPPLSGTEALQGKHFKYKQAGQEPKSSKNTAVVNPAIIFAKALHEMLLSFESPTDKVDGSGSSTAKPLTL